MTKAKYVVWHTDYATGTSLVGEASTIKTALTLLYDRVKSILEADEKWQTTSTNSIHINLKDNNSVRVFEYDFTSKDMPNNILYYENNILYKIKYGKLSTRTKHRLWAL